MHTLSTNRFPCIITFEMREYGGYTGRNPKTGESVDVKPKRTPFFKCGKDLLDMVNER